jgi:cullin 1
VIGYGSCIIDGHFNRSYEITTTPLQATILVQFNFRDEIAFEEIMTASEIDFETLKKMLHSLSCNKFNLLLKSGEQGKISDKDVFKVNNGFSSKLMRFTVPVP